METRDNYAVVGFFTLLVILAAFGFVYWMAQYGRGGPMADIVIRIPGSANGLSVGSPVRFNGIAVGSVRSLAIDADDPKFSVAFTEVNEDAPIYTSTKAILEIQGLTGAAYIELSGGETGDENILKRARDTGERAVLLADQSSVTNLLSTADKILGRADKAIGDIQLFVEESRGPLTRTVKNAETFSQAIADNADGIDTFLKSVSALSETITNVSGRLETTLAAVEDLVRAVDAKKVDNILANAEKVSGDVASASAELKGAMDKVIATADSFKAFGDNASRTLEEVDKLVASVDSAKVGTVVDNVTAAAADARQVVATVKKVTDDVEKRRGEIDRTIADFSDMSKTLNAASRRVDGILVKVDKLLGSDDSNSLFAEARRTLASFRSVADTLNARIGPIADNLSRFSGTGLRDVQTLVGETRQTIQNLNDTISGFNRDPQRLIFGGDTVKQYDGRTRR